MTVIIRGHKRKVTREVKTTVPGGLMMPTAFTAQNGMVIHQNTPVAVTGCGKAKASKSDSGNRGRKGGKK